MWKRMGLGFFENFVGFHILLNMWLVEYSNYFMGWMCFLGNRIEWVNELEFPFFMTCNGRLVEEDGSSTRWKIWSILMIRVQVKCSYTRLCQYKNAFLVLLILYGICLKHGHVKDIFSVFYLYIHICRCNISGTQMIPNHRITIQCLTLSSKTPVSAVLWINQHHFK